MPIFEYICEKCGVFDVLQLAGEKTLRFCPNCAKKKKKSKVVKKVSASSFHLKGTGWYKTDYADKTATDSAKAKSKKAAKETKSSDASSESTKAAEPAKSTKPAKAKST